MLVEKIKAKISASLSETKRNVSLAERMAGLPENTIRNILEGTSKNPKIETLQAIAKFLDCSLDELVGNIPKQQGKPKTDLPLDLKLLASIFEIINIHINKGNLKITFDQVMLILEKSYTFCYEKRNQLADKEFIEWLIDAGYE